MKKKSILKRKLIRAYNNADNNRWSLRKGYPEGTYFGYSSLKEYVKDLLEAMLVTTETISVNGNKIN